MLCVICDVSLCLSKPTCRICSGIGTELYVFYGMVLVDFLWTLCVCVLIT